MKINFFLPLMKDLVPNPERGCMHLHHLNLDCHVKLIRYILFLLTIASGDISSISMIFINSWYNTVVNVTLLILIGGERVIGVILLRQ